MEVVAAVAAVAVVGVGRLPTEPTGRDDGKRLVRPLLQPWPPDGGGDVQLKLNLLYLRRVDASMPLLMAPVLVDRIGRMVKPRERPLRNQVDPSLRRGLEKQPTNCNDAEDRPTVQNWHL